MLVGITIDEFKKFKPSFLLNIVNKLGLDFVEITETVFEDLPDVINTLGKIKTGFHLPNAGDSGYDFSSAAHQDNIEALIESINQNHKALNIQYCLTHPPQCNIANQSKSAIYGTLFTNLERLEPPIIIENIQSMSQEEFTAFYNEAKEALGDKVIGQCFDAAHCYLRGDDPIEILNQLDGEIRSIHLSDCEAHKDSHLPFGLHGVLPIDDILDAIKENQYDGIINLELLPRQSSHVKAVINSYLTVVSKFDKRKYMMTRLRLFYHLPSLMKQFSKI
ncbi:MAG: TIM barrel protein [candidate division KSB1 bacterium]|nr:TIM barrel protein [candidate division KSB1 bacterium]